LTAKIAFFHHPCGTGPGRGAMPGLPWPRRSPTLSRSDTAIRSSPSRYPLASSGRPRPNREAVLFLWKDLGSSSVALKGRCFCLRARSASRRPVERRQPIRRIHPESVIPPSDPECLSADGPRRTNRALGFFRGRKPRCGSCFGQRWNTSLVGPFPTCGTYSSIT